MSLRVRFEDEAEAEYRQAGVWYDSRREGLGIEFFDEVDTTIRQLLDLPRIGAPVPRASSRAAGGTGEAHLPTPRAVDDRNTSRVRG